jgi:antitoxin CptB
VTSDRARRSRLRWRCRRGVRELDVLLERFVDAGLADAEEAQRSDCERLLEQPDPLLIDWLILGVPPPPGLEDIVERIRAHAHAAPE